MSENNIIQLTACRYCELGQNVKVLNLNSLDYYMWAYVEPDWVRNCYLFKISELDYETDEPISEAAFVFDSISWIKINTSLIDRSPGQHTYKFEFMSKETDVPFSIYISYIIQTSHAEKSYIYMDRSTKDQGECIE